jgi:transposase
LWPHIGLWAFADRRKGGVLAIDEATEAKIRKLYYADHYTVHGISRSLGVHHTTVKRVIGAETFQRHRAKRPSILDPFEAVIDEQLNQYPKLPATRLIQILEDRGFQGSLSLVRHYLRKIRPRYVKPYMRMQVFAGEQAQVDWAHCGEIRIGKAIRKLYLFVMVLSFSRAIYARFCLNLNTQTFLRRHEDAFSYFGGIPRVILYDNLKSAVLSRSGNDIRFNPDLLEFAGFYSYEPRACWPYRGNEKGRVERSIRYLRDNFLSGRELSDFKTINDSLEQWCNRVGNRRPWPEDRRHTVAQRWAEERGKLMRLTNRRKEPKQVEIKRASKTPWVSFDLNSYSIDANFLGFPLSLSADDDYVEIYCNNDLIGRHARSYDRGRFIESGEHRQQLIEHRYYGRGALFRENLVSEFPAIESMLKRMFEHGLDLPATSRRLYRLLHIHGSESFSAAIVAANEKGTATIEGFQATLTKIEKDRAAPPRISVTLPDNPKVRDLSVKSHALEIYDKL